MKSVIAAMSGLAISLGAFGQPSPATTAAANDASSSDRDLSKPSLFVVAYAHLDTQWRWAYPQTIREFIANTLHHNFALFDKYPGYIFNFSGSRRYEMMEEYYPAEFAKLKQYVAAGKWFPCGSSVDENDANVPSAESLVRQVLYGNQYFRRTFGVASDEYMLPDCFGFPAALPQVLAHCGLKGFSTQKLTWNACVPIPFKVGVWEGPDGSGVIAALDPGAYVGEVKEDLATSNAWLHRIEANGKLSGVFADYHYYGTGDQGGAPKESSVAMVEQSIAAPGPVKVIPSRADEMFKAITPAMQARLPRYSGELQLTQHSAGSITSQAYMKRWNRKNELLADAAERAAVAAAWLGARDYPAAKLEDAWYLLLGSQMHDILPGTSLPKAYDYSWNDEVLAGNLFAAVLEDSAVAAIASMDTTGPGHAVVVYNPTSLARRDLVVAEVPGEGAAAVVRSPNGTMTPAQVIERKPGRSKIAFIADAPSVGFATYSVEFRESPSTKGGSLKATGSTIENVFYAVRLDENGDIASIFDRVSSRELLSGPARLGLHYENPSQWPAWNQDWEDRIKPAMAFVGGPADIRVVEDGPARVSLQVTRKAEGSTFTQTISLVEGSPRIECTLDILWNTRERSLRAAFPLAVSNAIASYDMQAGVIERPSSHPLQYEYCFQQWFDLTDTKGDYGVTVMCDSKYGSDKPDDRTLRLTLLHTPGTRGGYQDQGSQDIGHHRVTYAIYGHAGSWQGAASAQQAARMNQPLIPFLSTAHSGPLGRSFSLLTCSNDNVIVTAIKKAEDSNEVVVRLRELPGVGCSDVRLAMPTPIVRAREVDGQERSIAEARVQNGQVMTDVRRFGLRAFALTLGESPAVAEKSLSTPLPLAYDTDVVSTNVNRKDGLWQGPHAALPAEQLPSTVRAEGVTWTLGSTADGAMNAVTCRGQRITLPAGIDRIELLAAADEDVEASIAVGGTPHPWRVQAWRGFIGQWDRRLWKGETPESAYSWVNDIAGLERGFIKRDAVAWFATHHHTQDADAFYEFCYLYRYPIEVPAGATEVILPNEPRIKILAASAVRCGPSRAFAAAPLFDELPSTIEDGPTIIAPRGVQRDSTTVSIQPGMYWRAGAFRYTLDGSEPTPQSAVYAGPIPLHANAVLKVGMVDAAGRIGRVAESTIQVDDRTPPSIIQMTAVATSTKLLVDFSEPVEEPPLSAIAMLPAIPVRAAELTSDHRRMILTLAAAPAVGTEYQVTISGIRDRSPAHNTLEPSTLLVKPSGPVFAREVVADGDRVVREVPGLPVKGTDHWTLNLFVRTQKQPVNRTILAGFGACSTGRMGGGRYLSKFGNGIHFWSDNQDVESRTPLTLNQWQMLTATYDGRTLRLYKDAAKISEDQVSLVDDENIVNLCPKDPWDHRYEFAGDIKGVTIWNAALGEDCLAALLSGMPK